MGRFCGHSSFRRSLASRPPLRSLLSPPEFSLIRECCLCERGEQSLVLGNSWTELPLPHFCTTTGRLSFKPFGGRSWWKVQ